MKGKVKQNKKKSKEVKENAGETTHYRGDFPYHVFFLTNRKASDGSSIQKIPDLRQFPPDLMASIHAIQISINNIVNPLL
jgi:hypothetical protein